MQFTKGTKVKLKTFLGKANPTKGTNPQDNYWKIIGQRGEIIEDTLNYNDRVLVLFEKDLDQFEVANHNPIINSLWILPDDLELVE